MPDIHDADTKQRLREEQGEAYQKAVEYLRDSHVDVFSRQKVGDYIISVACEEAEGMYELIGKELTWKVPETGHNQHLEVIVQDADDLRFVPGLTVRATVKDKDCNVIAQLQPEFLWHPVASHYGQNFHIPGSGPYTIEVAFDPPPFGRHDEILGKRYEGGAQLSFGPLELVPEREPHGPE